MTDEEKETFLILKGWKTYHVPIFRSITRHNYDRVEGWWDPYAREFKVMPLAEAYELASNS